MLFHGRLHLQHWSPKRIKRDLLKNRLFQEPAETTTVAGANDGLSGRSGRNNVRTNRKEQCSDEPKGAMSGQAVGADLSTGAGI